MAIITSDHCVIELTPIKREGPRGKWFDIKLSMQFRNQDQVVEYRAPSSGISMEEPEMLRFIEQTRHYLESPAPRALSKESMNHHFRFSPMECRFFIEFHSYLQRHGDKRYTRIDFKMPLLDLGMDGSVGCSITLLTEVALVFINTFEQEYRSVA